MRKQILCIIFFVILIQTTVCSAAIAKSTNNTSVKGDHADRAGILFIIFIHLILGLIAILCYLKAGNKTKNKIAV